MEIKFFSSRKWMSFTLSALLALCAAGPQPALAAAADEIGALQIPMSGGDPESAVVKLVGDVRAIFRNYRPAGVTVVKEPEVSGSSTHPFMTVTMEKCVLIACQTVEMKADITVAPSSGKCAKNYLLRADISRSSDLLSGQYGALDFKICFNKGSDGKAALAIKALAERGPGYGGAFQPVVFDVLKAQIEPIGAAIKKTLKAISDKP